MFEPVASRFDGPSGKIFKPTMLGEWSPDGKRLALAASAPGEFMPLFTIESDGSGAVERHIAESSRICILGPWLDDGRRLLFTEQLVARAGFDLFELDLEARTSRPLFDTRTVASRTQPDLSPDGEWLAYTSRDSGRDEVYITRYDRPGGRQIVSTEGGASPVWSPDGERLYYRNGSAVMAVEMTLGREPRVGTPRLLFEGRYLELPDGALPRIYDLSPDGKRFVMIESAGREREIIEFELVLNWFQELNRLVPIDP